MKSSLYVVVFCFCITLSQFAHSQAWEATNEWNGMQTELEYERWFLDKFTPDFYFKKTGLLMGEVGVDCGKAAYVARAVFAFETNRRFLAWGRDNGWIDSSRIAPYTGKPEEKLRAFLKSQVIGRTNVESMKDNTFPIQIQGDKLDPNGELVRRTTLTAGVVFNFQLPGFENSEAGRHAYIVKDITPGGYIRFIWATVPIAPRMMSERTLYPIYMPTLVSLNNQWGFRRFYQPNDYANKVLELKNIIPLNGRIESNPAAQEAEAKMQALLKTRGYSLTHQNELAQEVLNDYEVEKESRRVVGGFAPRSKTPAKTETAKSDSISKPGYSGPELTPPGPYMAAPGFRRITILDIIFDRNRRQLEAMMGHGQPSIIDRMLDDARRASEEFAENNKPRPKIVRNIVFPKLKQNGTFVADPDVIVEGVSVINIYHGKLVSLLQRNEETLEQSLERQYFNLCSYLHDRVAAVEEGYRYFHVFQKIMSAPYKFNRCPTMDEMYNYTTPDRDGEFRDYVNGVRNYFLENREEIKATLPNWYLTMAYSLGEPMHPHYTSSVMTTAYANLQRALNSTKKFIPQNGKNYCEVMLDLRGGRTEAMSIRRFVPIITKSFPFFNHEKKISVTVPLVSVVPTTGIERRWGLHGINQALYNVEYNIETECATKQEATEGAAGAK